MLRLQGDESHEGQAQRRGLVHQGARRSQLSRRNHSSVNAELREDPLVTGSRQGVCDLQRFIPCDVVRGLSDDEAATMRQRHTYGPVLLEIRGRCVPWNTQSLSPARPVRR